MVVGSGVVAGVGVANPVELSTGWLGDTWTVGPCAWGLAGGAGLAVEWGAVYSAGPSVLLGWLVPVAVAACARVAPVVAVAAPGGALLRGPPARGVLRDGAPAVAVEGVCRADVGTGDGGAPEATPSATPSTAAEVPTFIAEVPTFVAEVPTFVLCAVSAEPRAEVSVAAEVPWVTVTGARVSVVVLSSVSTDAFCFTNTPCVLLGAKCP